MSVKITYNVLMAPIAADRLDAHMRFLARVSESASERLHDIFYADINSLSLNPQRCPVYEPKSKSPISPLRWMLSAKRYRIVFGIQDNTVLVFDVQDCRQDTDKNMV